MSAIKHRIATGRLHPVRAGVYAVGRPDLTRAGEWMAAVLSCGPDAVLSHGSAAALWRLAADGERRIHVTVPSARDRRQPGIALHRRSTLGAGDVAEHRGVPVTSPIRTLMDIANAVPAQFLEAAVNEADKLDLAYTEELRLELELRKGQPGVRPLRALLDKVTSTLTDSELERRFLPIARGVGAAQAADASARVRVQGRLLLAGTRPRRGDRWPSLSPNTGRASARSHPRPSPLPRPASPTFDSRIGRCATTRKPSSAH